MKIAILYDLKRSLLKPVVLFMLVLFAILGISTTYSTYIFISNMYRPIDGTVLHAVSINESNVSCILMGGIFDRRGNLVEGSLTIISNNSRIYSFEAKSTFVVENTTICRYINAVEISTPLTKFNISCTLIPLTPYSAPHQYIGVGSTYSASYTLTSVSLCGGHDGYIHVDDVLIVFKMFINNLRSAKARLYTFSVNTSSLGKEIEKSIKLNYSFSSFISRVTPTGIITSISGSHADEPRGSIVIDKRFKEFDLTIDLDNSFMNFHHVSGSSSQTISLNYGYQVAMERSYIDFITGSLGIGLYLSFFPIAVLYIANILVAKPRSSGALEFVLARPITRFDLYLSRYVAGVILIAVSSAILLTVIAVFYPLVLRIELDLASYVLLYLGVSASLITFYSLCYAIASTMRSGLYLAISIGLYIFFSIIWNIIMVITAYNIGVGIMSKGYEELTYAMSYLNPLNFVNLARYHILTYYGVVHDIPIVNPVLCIAIPLIWNLVLFYLGFQRFKKIILTS